MMLPPPRVTYHTRVPTSLNLRLGTSSPTSQKMNCVGKIRRSFPPWPFFQKQGAMVASQPAIDGLHGKRRNRFAARASLAFAVQHLRPSRCAI